MEYYSAFMHKFSDRKKKTRNLRLPFFFQIENLFMMCKWEFGLCMDKDLKFKKYMYLYMWNCWYD